MPEYKIGYFDDIVNIDDYIERNGKYVSNSEIVDILNKLSKENYALQDGLDFYLEQNAYLSEQINELEEKKEKIKQNLKEETDRVIKLEQYIYTKLCPKSEHYDEKALSEIINGILGGVPND